MPVPQDEPRLNPRLCRPLSQAPWEPCPCKPGSAHRPHGQVNPPFLSWFSLHGDGSSREVLWLSPAGPTRPTSGGFAPCCPYITSSLRTAREILISSPSSNSMLFLGMCIAPPALRKTDKLEPRFSAAFSGCLRKMQLTFRRGKTYTQV